MYLIFRMFFNRLWRFAILLVMIFANIEWSSSDFFWEFPSFHWSFCEKGDGDGSYLLPTQFHAFSRGRKGKQKIYHSLHNQMSLLSQIEAINTPINQRRAHSAPVTIEICGK